MNSSLVKNKICSSFSKASSTYDAHSETHQIIADYVITHCPHNFPDGPILDLGAGTGILTKKLLCLSKPEEIIAIDFSYPMLKELGSKGTQFCLACADFDNLPFQSESFSLIGSSTSLQWTEKDISSLMSNNLKKNGIFAISVILDGTFKELRKIKSALLGEDETSSPLPLPQFNDLKKSFTENTSLSLLKYEKHTFISEYNSMNDLLIAIKSLGIGETNQAKLNSSQLNQLKEKYESYSMDKFGSIAINYEVGFFWGKKED
jgi:malonyl-CoA O-methyltransferase